MMEAGNGYISFILRMVADWETNASGIYGMTDAILGPPRVDGTGQGQSYHYSNDYPHVFVNGITDSEAAIEAIIAKYKPEQMSIEELFFTKNITTGIRVAEARGIVLMAGEEAGIPMFEYTPMQVKQAVVGYGLAEKKQVIQLVTMILNLPAPPKPDDTAGALAIAICHAHSGCSRLAEYYNK